MKYEELKNITDSVRHGDKAAMTLAWKRLDSLAKPPRSLGVLEETAAKLAGVTGEVKNRIERRRIIVMAADNGVTDEGVSSAPRSVTLTQTKNILHGITGVCALAKAFNAEVEVVDVGIDGDVSDPSIINRKLMRGTDNIRKTAAMSRQTAIDAIAVGIERAKQAKADGMDAIGTGEMGIGNTTTSSAVLAALTGLSAEDITGRGAGMTDSAYENKKRIIREALAVNKPDAGDVIDVLAKVGGLDIAAMTGLFIGAAAERMPVVVDGFISIVAALSAARLCPAAVDYMFLSHASYEIGYNAAAEALGLKPFMLLEMRLGEGSGCPMGFMIMDAACAVISDIATFAEASISDEYLDAISEGDCFSVDK